MTLLRITACAALAGVALPALAIDIDGRLAPGEWAGARHIDDFRQNEPLTGKPAQYPVQAWVLATPEGLAVAVRVSQPAGIARTTQRVARDFHDPVDRVNVNVDFSASGRTGYNFTVAATNDVSDAVITNERQVNTDWDGQWQHAVSSDAEGWTAELLIPWYTAPMRKSVNGKRTLAINIDRVIGSLGLRASWPLVSYSRPRFLSEFANIEVPAYSQQLLAITPYTSAIYDNIGHDGSFDGGADIFWKPSGQFQLTATLNPDFGQVESDDLVVNFDATETWFSDKRPFFTENQGLFDFSLLDDNSALVYTRRVGGPADDGRGVGDIVGAVKLNGSVGATSYGVLAADERGDAGRKFTAVRVVHEWDTQSLGAIVTDVDRPFLGRRARVLGLDHRWHPSADFTIASNVVGSDIDQHGLATRGYGATVLADLDMGGGWRQEWLAMHFDDRLQVNDFGYLGRNNYDYAHWEVARRFTDLPDESHYSAHDWRVRVDALDNGQGLRLRRELRIERDSNLRGGATENLSVQIRSAANDDMLTRGHGALRLPPSQELGFERQHPRRGDWAWGWELRLERAGINPQRRIARKLELEPTWFISDAFSVAAELTLRRDPDWLIWQHDNLLGRFDQRGVELATGVLWSIGQRQELRLKLQAIGMDARLRDAWRVAPDGRPVPSNEPFADFTIRNLGLQLRYRRELAPMSYLYVVYGRGGYLLDHQDEHAFGLLQNSFSLRDGEQLLIKLNYRFDL